jgi:hypothetical protein
MVQRAAFAGHGIAGLLEPHVLDDIRAIGFAGCCRDAVPNSSKLS